jgi:radical SAM superfamily enzyme
MPQNELVLLLNEIRERLPNVKRIGSYASAHALVNKSCDDLLELKDKGLRIIHMGLESGDNATLAHVKKYGTSELIIDQGQKVRRAGINLFVTVILGIAGINRSVVHATSTGNALSHIDPDYVGALSLMLVPEAPLYKEWKAGSFTIPDAPGMLQELYIMLKNTNLTRGIFYANHASNYLPIRARLPRDKDAVLEKIRKALDGDVALRPEWLRGL